MHLRTPLIHSLALSQACDRKVWLKLEALQASGSFKLRGVAHACRHYLAHGARRLVSSSGGNAGLAVAYVGLQLGVPVTVVVPQTTSEHARALLRLHQAEVVVHGASWQEAHALALSLVSSDAAMVHPFDDPLLWQGHASLVDEIAEEATHANLQHAAMVLSVGGGGLLAGVCEGLQRQGWLDTTVIAAETEGADAYAQSRRAGERITLEQITSIASSLGAKQVCEQAMRCADTVNILNATVSDAAAVCACARFLDDHRLLVEPACGASLALAYDRNPVLDRFDELVIVVCGGATTTAAQLRQWMKQYAVKL